MAFWFWITLAILFLLIVAALVSRIRFRIRYSRSGRLDHLVVNIEALYGIFHYKIEIPSILIRSWNVIYRQERIGGYPGGTKFKEVKRPLGEGKLAHLFKVYRRIIRPKPAFRRTLMDSLKKVECTRWRLDWRVGTGDPALTGTTAGLLWGVSGCVVGVASQMITLRTSPQGRIEPNFFEEEFALVWESDYQIRLGTAMWSTMKLGTKAVQYGKSLRYWTSLLQGPAQA